MGPSKMGIGSGARSRLLSAPPAAPGNGSGGGGILNVGNTARGIDLSPALTEASDATTGRVTLGMVNFTILLMLGFYAWTHSAQGGG